MKTLTEFEKRFKYDPGNPKKSGGQAVIYLAEDLIKNFPVGLKRAAVTDSYSVQAEFEMAKQFDHPNLLKYYEVFRLSTSMGMYDFGIMEWVENSLTFEQYFKSYEAKAYKKQIIKGILEGLAYLHRRDVVHRDLKPSNILIKVEYGNPVPKIIDFGVSKQLSNDVTSHSMIVGTPSFMPPEQILPKKGEIIHPNCDLWSFGVILFTLEVGKSPFGLPAEGYTSDQIRGNILDGNFLKSYADVEEPYRRIIELCLVKNPRDRVKSADELIKILDQKFTHEERYKYNPNKPFRERGQSAIYNAFDNFEYKEVGLKRAPVTGNYSIQQEFELARNLDHENLLKYYDSFRRSTSMGMFDYGIMEWIDHGLTIDQYFNKQESGKFKKQIIAGVLEGIEYLHKNGVIHSDLRPGNILIKFENGKPIPKIKNFGVRKIVNNGIAPQSIIIGKTSFMSPEQIKGDNLNSNSDLWSLGVILFTIEAGRSPFGLPTEGYSDAQIKSNILNGKFTTPIEGIQEPYQKIIKRCLINNPTKRAKSAAELLQILKQPGVSVSTFPIKQVLYSIAAVSLIAVNAYFILRLIEPELPPTAFIVSGCATSTFEKTHSCTKEKIENTIERFIIYPEEAKKLKISGMVEAKFEIDTAGIFRNISITKDIGGGCGETVRNAIEKAGMELTIEAATKNGQKIPTSFKYSHTFTLKESR